MTEPEKFSIGECRPKRVPPRHHVMRNPDIQHRLNIELSPFTGRYVWGGCLSQVERRLIEKYGGKAGSKNFAALRDAYLQFNNEGVLNKAQRLEMLWEIVWLFHQNFSFTDKFNKRRFCEEYPFFVESVLEIINNYNIPPLIKADLCRQAGLFGKPLDYVGRIPIKSMEWLLMEEVCMRAARHDRYPLDYETVWNCLPETAHGISPLVHWFYNGFLY